MLTWSVIAPASPATAAAREPSTRALQIEVSKAGLIRLDGAAAAVFIADPEVCDIQVKSPSLIYLIGRKPGETTLYAVDDEDRLIEAVTVSVVHNLSRLRQAVRSLHPEADVGLSSIGNAVVIKGQVPTAKVADDVGRLASTVVDQQGTVINRLAVTAPTQVNLRVRVAEIDRGIQKQLGVRWDVIGQIGSVQLGFFAANPFSLTVPGGLGFSGAAVRSVTDNADVNAIIDALANENLISVLAEPNLTAMSGESASFLAGGEFPILVPQGFERVTVEFKKFGVSLEFTPTIVGQDRVSLNVRPEVSELSTQGEITIPVAGGQITIPALTVRRAQTTVELGSGQSFAIAGLLQNRSETSLQKYPLLGDVPVIGALFRSDRFRRNDTELVIIVTPYIVRPVAAGSLAAPTDGFSSPSDADRILHGGTHRRNPNTGPGSVVAPGGRRATGPMGFILE